MLRNWKRALSLILVLTMTLGTLRMPLLAGSGEDGQQEETAEGASHDDTEDTEWEEPDGDGGWDAGKPESEEAEELGGEPSRYSDENGAPVTAADVEAISEQYIGDGTMTLEEEGGEPAAPLAFAYHPQPASAQEVREIVDGFESLDDLPKWQFALDESWLPAGWAQAEFTDEETGADYWTLTIGPMRTQLKLAPLTVTFDPDNGIDDPVRVQVNFGEKALERPAPSLPAVASSFLGWFEEGAAENADPFNFDTAITSDLTLVGRYSNKLLVQYKNARGMVIHSVQLSHSDRVPSYAPDTAKLELDEGEVFNYWYLEGGDVSLPYTFGEPITQSITLLPYLSRSHYVVFHSNGGSPVDPVMVEIGRPVVQPATAPERLGYAFDCWSEDKDGGVAYDFGQPVTGNLTLYAVWTPTPVRYSITYWIESKNLPGGTGNHPSNYTFVNTQERAALAGSLVSADSGWIVVQDGHDTRQEQNLNDTLALSQALSSPALTYSTYVGGDSQVALKGDGSTTINVYYNRNEYTYVFDVGGPISLDSGDRVTPVLVMNGQIYHGAEYAVTLKYEQDLTGIYPTSENVSVYLNEDTTQLAPHDTYEYAFCGWKSAIEPNENDSNASTWSTWSTERYILALDMMPKDPAENIVPVEAQISNTAIKRTPHYYLQILDYDVFYEEYDSDSVTLDRGVTLHRYGPYGLFDNTLFVKDEALSAPLYTMGLVRFGAKDIKGFEAYSAVYKAYTTEPYLFYSRMRSTMTFDAQGGADSYVYTDVAYGQPLEELWIGDPYLDGYNFMGWYTHPTYRGDGEFFPEVETMPAHDFTLYAHWEPADHTAYFYNSTGEGSPFAQQGVVRGGTVDFGRDELYTVGQHVEGRGQFLGWLYRNSNGTLVQYPVDNPVYGETLHLYANWQTDGFQVIYDTTANGGNGSVSDWKRYSPGADAQLMPAEDVTPPARQVFVGWRENNEGLSRYPYNLHRMADHNANMVARYVPSGKAYRLTYDANNGSGAQISYHVEMDEHVQLMGSYFQHPGYDQAGWSLAPGGAVDYALCQEIILDRDTILYAVWEGDGIWHTVRFESNGGSAVADQQVNNNAHAQRPADPARSGYAFVAWYADKALTSFYDFSAPVTEDLTLYACWTVDDDGGSSEGNGSSGGGDSNSDRGSSGHRGSSGDNIGSNWGGFTVNIPDADIPLGNLVEIIDSSVPLASAPNTGDSSRKNGVSLLGAIALLLAILFRPRKDDKSGNA